MTAEYNFVQVMDALFEPDLKLRISISVPYEAPSSFEIWIDRDPEIVAGRLTMPPPSWLVQIWQRSNATPAPDLVPFESGEIRSVSKLLGTVEGSAAHVKFVFRHLSNGFANHSTKIEEALGDDLAGRGFELIHQILKAAMALPFWDEQARLHDPDPGRATPSQAMTVGLYLERPLAEQLADHSSFSFDDDQSEGDVLVAQREVRL